MSDIPSIQPPNNDAGSPSIDSSDMRKFEAPIPPPLFSPRRAVTEATILFADMVDSSMLSHVHKPWEYDEIVSTFQRMCAQVLEEMHIEIVDLGCHAEASIRGDEMALILGCTPGGDTDKEKEKHETQLRRCTRLALQVAIRLKRRWLLEEPNQTRISYRQPPLAACRT